MESRVYSLMHLIFSIIPKNSASRLTGLVSRLEMGPLGRCMAKVFAFVFRLRMDEAVKGPYGSIEAVFTRRLREGVRPVGSAVVSSADGQVLVSAPVKSGDAVQAKGLTYSVSELLFGAEQRDFDPGWVTTVYLAPHNYHRVHSPVSGELLGYRYFPGELWPVNGPFWQCMPRLYNRNERIVFHLRHEGKDVYVAMVGAYNVGCIRPSFGGEFLSNSIGFREPFETQWGEPQPIAAGDELGVFMLGSTVVTIFDRACADQYNFSIVDPEVCRPRNIQMGASLLE